MIPDLTEAGVIPPFLPEQGPTALAAMAPYRVSITEVALKFGNHSAERTRIFCGLLDYRARLRALGIEQGFQWIAGSYLEDCEKLRGRPPKDVDVVTFARRPPAQIAAEAWEGLVLENRPLFTRADVMKSHHCDTFFEDLCLPSEYLVSKARYWFGLMSHQRETFLWKGILEVKLVDDDASARAILIGGRNNAQ